MKIPLTILTLTLSLANAFGAERTFPTAGLKKIAIAAGAGDIQVSAADGKDALVDVLKADPEKCEITMKVEGGALVLMAKDKQGFTWHKGCEAGFRVRAPKALALELEAGSGDVRLRGMAGDLKVKLGSGDLKGDDRAARVEIKSGSGSVRLENLIGTADVSAGSGDVALAWADIPSAGDIGVRVGSGAARLTFPAMTQLRSRLVSGSGSVTNELGDTPSAGLVVSVKAGSGDVVLAKRPPSMNPRKSAKIYR